MSLRSNFIVQYNSFPCQYLHMSIVQAVLLQQYPLQNRNNNDSRSSRHYSWSLVSNVRGYWGRSPFVHVSTVDSRVIKSIDKLAVKEHENYSQSFILTLIRKVFDAIIYHR